jgi:hypothetical protein
MPLTKEKVIELIKALPDDVTVDDIMAALYFRSQVDEGLAQLDRGEGIPHEDVVDFLRGRLDERRLVRAHARRSEDAFRKVWGNQDDATYDKL